MLYISRQVGEKIIVNSNIIITIVEIKGKKVKVGVEFPGNASVLREELYNKIKNANISASNAELNPDSIKAFENLMIKKNDKFDPLS